LSVIALLSWHSVDSVKPYGASVTEVGNESAPIDIAGNHSALAGNVTEISLFSYTTTQSWQGYYGNVSGTIQLADSVDNVLYNWSVADPEGEVYATINGSVNWINIQCFNFTATGTLADDSGQRGGTSLYGHNESTMEIAYGINTTSDDVDGLNESFSIAGTHELGNGYTHDPFFTNNLQFTTGECPSAHLFSSGGVITDNQFQEVLLYSPDSQNIIFTAVLEQTSINGFDGNDHDFQMIVLEDGHGVDENPTMYYFYVELE
jgi:hypothetical protein